ncbi:MAG: TorF family putative porin [bacterium]
MKSSLKKTVVASAVALGLFASAQASAEVSFNVGATSNYLWRGVTQSSDSAAVSGGIDYNNESGFYLGTWVSNVSWTTNAAGDAYNNYEADLYAGFGGEMSSGVGYDLGVIGYFYPIGDTESDFYEVYGGLSLGGFSGNLAYTFDTEAGGDGDIYASLGYDMDLGNDMGLGLLIGRYDFDAGGDYTHFAASLSKGDFTFALEKTDIDGDDDPRLVASWGTSF